MAGTLTFVLFAVLFYIIMRYGCGAHMVHGHGGHEHGAQGSHDAATRAPSKEKLEADPQRYVPITGGVR